MVGKNEAAGAADAAVVAYTGAMGRMRSLHQLCRVKLQLFHYQQSAIEIP